MNDDDLNELAYSAHAEAMSFGLSHDTFLRYFKAVRDRTNAKQKQWEDLRTAATVITMRADQMRGDRPMPPEIAALERCLEELGTDGVMACRKCGGAMKPGKAMAQTMDCSDEGTCSPAGPGKLIDCMKCERCGWSVTAGVEGRSNG